jgi:hypothetical protein
MATLADVPRHAGVTASFEAAAGVLARILEDRPRTTGPTDADGPRQHRPQVNHRCDSVAYFLR